MGAGRRFWLGTTRRRLGALAIAGLALLAALLLARDRLFGPAEVASVTGWVTNVQRARLRAIAREGEARGNLPGVFTLVGDSISADGRFLKPIAQGAVDLGAYDEFASTLDFFSQPNGRGENAFGARSWAVQVGWMTESVLDPALSVRPGCGADETPLECEYRTARPSVALIMLGTNDLAGGRALESYRANLRQIVDVSLAMGVIPVLSTIPPQPASAARDARVADFNAAVRAVAAAYDLPLWDYWRALQDVPDYGISADGVHPNAPPDGAASTFDAEHLAYGYTVRNLGALDALDAVRRALE